MRPGKGSITLASAEISGQATDREPAARGAAKWSSATSSGAAAEAKPSFGKKPSIRHVSDRSQRIPGYWRPDSGSQTARSARQLPPEWPPRNRDWTATSAGPRGRCPFQGAGYYRPARMLPIRKAMKEIPVSAAERSPGLLTEQFAHGVGIQRRWGKSGRHGLVREAVSRHDLIGAGKDDAPHAVHPARREGHWRWRRCCHDAPGPTGAVGSGSPAKCSTVCAPAS